MLNINANTYETLKAFGDFAIKFGSDSKAVARTGIGESGLAVNRTLDDKAYAFSRAANQKLLNNDTRAEFRNAIASLFGGEERIPRNVKKAMILGDYGKGKPLTARRIAEVAVAVTDAIRRSGGLQVEGRTVDMPALLNDFGAAAVKGGVKLADGLGLLPQEGGGIKLNVPGGAAELIENGIEADPSKGNGIAMMSKATASKTAAARTAKTAKDMLPVAMNAQAARKMVAASEKRLGVELLDDARELCADLLAKYGDGLPAKSARVLSNFIVNNVAHGEHDEDSGYIATPFEDRLKVLSEEMKEWRNFDFGDPGLQQLGTKFVQLQNDYVKNTSGDPTMFSEDQPDVFKQLYGDAHRGKWKINGKQFNPGTPPEVIGQKFLETVKTPAARKALSILCNQGNLADLEKIQAKEWIEVDDTGKQFANGPVEPGAGMFVSHAIATDQLAIACDVAPSFELEVSADGKTAVVTVSIDRNISSNAMKNNDCRIGTVKISQRSTVDLTQKPLPVVTDVTFSQTFSPDTIRRDPNGTNAYEG